jgi:hypothetical protein
LDSGLTGPFLRLFSAQAPTLYGQPLAVIAVLVAINQPFTIWMLRSFFANIPAELDEAARGGWLFATRGVLARHYSGHVARRDYERACSRFFSPTTTIL